jgi:K+-sensing histidine kinase KdpD
VNNNEGPNDARNFFPRLFAFGKVRIRYRNSDSFFSLACGSPTLLGEGVPFILYYPAIVIAAWFGGLWPGILSTVLGGLIAWYVFIPPTYSFVVSNFAAPAQSVIFFLVGTLTSLLAESLHEANSSSK